MTQYISVRPSDRLRKELDEYAAALVKPGLRPLSLNESIASLCYSARTAGSVTLRQHGSGDKLIAFRPALDLAPYVRKLAVPPYSLNDVVCSLCERGLELWRQSRAPVDGA